MYLDTTQYERAEPLFEEIVAARVERFGEDARFHSCSASGMDVPAVIAFLESRGKFVARDEGFNTAPDRICNH